jgi:hypothetical protein
MMMATTLRQMAAAEATVKSEIHIGISFLRLVLGCRSFVLATNARHCSAFRNNLAILAVK